MKKRVTIKDVAREAGVSHPTVSRVIHGTGKISPATCERVQKAITKLNYRPNLIARSLITKSTRVIATIVPDLNPHVLPILRGITDECRRNQYALMLSSTEYWADEQEAYLSVIDHWQVDGVVIYNVAHHKSPAKELRPLRKQSVPYVFINKYLSSRSVDAVGIDNFNAVKQAIDYLVQLGHQRIGCLHGGLMSVDGVERREAFVQAMENHNLPVIKSLCGDANFSDVEAYEETRRILNNRQRPTALFCANDLMALGACNAIKAHGLNIPTDISVIGYDDLIHNPYFSPPLTTLHPPLKDVGKNALELLLARIENPNGRHRQIGLNAELIIRESTGPCK